MYAIYGNIYHQYTPNVSIYTIHGSYGNGSSNREIAGVVGHFRLWNKSKLITHGADASNGGLI